MKNIKGITLIALVITIVVLIILSAIVLGLSLGENGLFNKAETAKEETIKQAAKEKIDLKITNIQMQTYSNEKRMPTLQEFADSLCEDNEIQYVELQSKKVATLDKIEVGEATSIFTKLTEYPYEFEINSSLQLVSIAEVQIENNNLKEPLQITKNGKYDVKEYDEVNVNIETGSSLELIWTNSNPNSGFGAQTISMDLSNYEAVLMYVKAHMNFSDTANSTNYPSYTYGKVGETVYCNSGAKGISGTWYTTFRSATISTTGIQFGEGRYGQATGIYSNNTIGIPLYIWGVKKDIYN